MLDDAAQLGRSVEVGSDQIETLNEHDQHYTMWEIANILKLSKSIKLLVKIKNVSFILQKTTKWTFWPTQYLTNIRENSREIYFNSS